MTSTQEPNTMAPQSALCICSRKRKAKLIVPIYFVRILFNNHFFFITGVRVKFRFERLQNKLRSSTFDNCEMISLLGALRALYNISSDDGEDLFADELLVYQEWKARYEVEKEENENRKENSRTALDGKLRA